jgi:hypothetical protein
VSCSSRVRLCFGLACLFAAVTLQTQESPATHPPDYPGVRIFIPGVFVTPVPGAPFSGTVEILSKQLLPNGTTYTRRTTNHIARNYTGVIYNEHRKLVPSSFQGEPLLLASHIYDPQTRISTSYFPATHVARQAVLATPPSAPENSTPGSMKTIANAQQIKTEDLGTENFAGLPLRGTRKIRTVPADVSGTGHEVKIIDDYWYSEDLKVYLVVKHQDPRSGEQYVGITEANRKEPEPSTFQIPPGYKVVDVTPPQRSRP